MGSSLWTGGWPREEGQVGCVGRGRGELCPSRSQPRCAWILGPPVGIEGTDALLPPQEPPFSLVLLFLLSLSIEASKPFQKLPLRMFAQQLGREKNLSVTTAGRPQKAPLSSSLSLPF